MNLLPGNWAAVDEVMSVAGLDLFLKGNFMGAQKDLANEHIVKTVPADGIEAGAFGADYWDLGSDGLSYQDIRHDSSSKSDKVLFDHLYRGSLRDLNNKCFGGIVAQSVSRRIVDPQGVLSDWIEDDFFRCAKEALVFGRVEGFWGDVLDVYRKGCMPVGWWGKYPSGKFMVIAGEDLQ